MVSVKEQQREISTSPHVTLTGLTSFLQQLQDSGVD